MIFLKSVAYSDLVYNTAQKLYGPLGTPVHHYSKPGSRAK